MIVCASSLILFLELKNSTFQLLTKLLAAIGTIRTSNGLEEIEEIHDVKVNGPVTFPPAKEITYLVDLFPFTYHFPLHWRLYIHGRFSGSLD